MSGELRTFTYADTVHESKIVNFVKEYPDVKLRTATFESNDEAAAKIKAGFKTDVIEVCLDEQGPLVEAGMLAPIDTSKLDHWDDLDPTFRDAAGVTNGGDVTMIPTQAGAVGLIYDKDEFPDGVDSGRPCSTPIRWRGRPGRRLLADAVRHHGAGQRQHRPDGPGRRGGR